MAHYTADKKKLRGGVILLVALLVGALALVFPAQAYDKHPPPTPAPSTAGPSDHHHPDQALLDGPAPFSPRELFAATCSGGMAAEYPCQGIDFMSRVPL